LTLGVFFFNWLKFMRSHIFRDTLVPLKKYNSNNKLFNSVFEYTYFLSISLCKSIHHWVICCVIFLIKQSYLLINKK